MLEELRKEPLKEPHMVMDNQLEVGHMKALQNLQLEEAHNLPALEVREQEQSLLQKVQGQG